MAGKTAAKGTKKGANTSALLEESAHFLKGFNAGKDGKRKRRATAIAAENGIKSAFEPSIKKTTKGKKAAGTKKAATKKAKADK